MLKKWKELPEFMKNDDVRPYYEILKKKKLHLLLKQYSKILQNNKTMLK